MRFKGGFLSGLQKGDKITFKNILACMKILVSQRLYGYVDSHNVRVALILTVKKRKDDRKYRFHEFCNYIFI